MLVAIPVAASIKLILDFVYPPDPNDEKRHEKHGALIGGLVSFFFKPTRPSTKSKPKPSSHISVPQVDQEPSQATSQPVGTVLKDGVD